MYYEDPRERFPPAPQRGFGPAKARKRKKCPFTQSGVKEIDYKDTENLMKFITERGKILPRRITGVSAHHQRLLTNAIKRARAIALLPFSSEL